MAKKKSSTNNNNIKEDIIDSDDGEWETVPTKEQRNKENNEKRDKKKLDKEKKRLQEIQEHNEKQKKIAELFSNSARAFDVKNRPVGYNPWDILDEDEDDFTYSHQHHQKKSNQASKQQAENPNNGFHYPGSDKLSNSSDKLKKKKKQQSNTTSTTSTSTNQSTIENAIKTFDFNKYYELLKTIENKYPKVIDVQIKCVAECLEEHFGSVPSDTLPFYQRIDYLSKFDDKFKKETTKFFTDKPISNILPTVIFLVNNIISILRKDRDAIHSSGVGLEILLQVIFRYLPISLLKNVQYFKSLNLQTLKPNVVSIYLWFFNQPIHNNLHSVTASMWLQVVFPILYKAKVPVFANLELFEKFTVNLFELKRIQKNGIEIDQDVLENSLDEFINSLILQTVQPVGLKYSNILFDVKKLFAKNQVQPAYFYKILSFTTINDEVLRERFLNISIDCLNMDNRCFEYLKSKYVDIIAQVNNLLLYILLKWKDLESSGTLVNLTKQSVYDFATFCRDENKSLYISYNKHQQLLQQQNQQQQQKPNQKKQQPKLNFDIEEVNLCQITVNSVIQAFKPSIINLKKLTYIVMVPLVLVGGYYTRQITCSGNLNLGQYLASENIELLHKYIC